MFVKIHTKDIKDYGILENVTFMIQLRMVDEKT